MRTLTLDRNFYIPAGALCVRDKLSDAVAYLYTNAAGAPCAMGFHGKAQKPDFRFRYRSPAERETAVRNYFEGRQKRAAFAAKQKAERTQPGKLEVGHVLYASWGYEQTNIDWFQVTAIISATMIELRPIGSVETRTDGWASGQCVPDVDNFTGPAVRRHVRYGVGVKVDKVRYASLWDGRPRSWTAYH